MRDVKHVKRTLVIGGPPKSWELFDELCKRTDRAPGMMFYHLLAVLTGYCTPDTHDGPEIEKLDCELYGLLTKALRPGAGRQAVGASGSPLVAGRVISFAAASEQLRLLRERGL